MIMDKGDLSVWESNLPTMSPISLTTQGVQWCTPLLQDKYWLSPEMRVFCMVFNRSTGL